MERPRSLRFEWKTLNCLGLNSTWTESDKTTQATSHEKYVGFFLEFVETRDVDCIGSL